MATPAEVETLREYFRGLSPEQRATFRTLVKDNQRKAPTPIKSESGETLSFPHRAIMRSENLDPGTPEGKVNNAMMLMMGFGGAVGGLLSAAKTGLPALGKAAVTMGGRTATGAAIGAGLGMTPLPIVGGHGAVEGAKFGAMMGAGQGGMGALWKHGKKKKILQYLIEKVGPKQADEVLEAVAAEASQGVPRGMATSMARQADDVAGSVSRAPVRIGGASTTAPVMSAPAPAASASQGKTLGDIIEPKPAVNWTRQGGEKARRAYLESRGHIPGAMTADDVAAMRARGATTKQIEDALLRNSKQGGSSGMVKQGNLKPTRDAVSASAATAKNKAKTVGGLIEPAKTGEPWRVVIQYGKHKGKSGIKVKHGMGRGQTRPGGGTGPRHDTIRLDDGSEVVVPSTNVLTDFGKATHPSVQKAIDASRAKSLGKSSEPASGAAAKASHPSGQTLGGLIRKPTKPQVDRRLREAQEGLRDKIRQIDEAGNLKTVSQGRSSMKKGYEQRDLVDDYVNGFEIDPNAEYVLNQSKLGALHKSMREMVERELTEELAVPF